MASALSRFPDGLGACPPSSEDEGGEPSPKRTRDAVVVGGPSTPSSGAPRELCVSVPNNGLDIDQELLLKHLSSQTTQIAFMQIQINHLTDLMRHQNRCLAMYTKRKEFEEDAPPSFNPLVDQAPVPDPKSERESDFRDMTQLEVNMLEREINYSMPFKRMRDNMRKILDPENWYKSTRTELDLQELPNKQMWKLWALVRNKERLDNVLTPAELAACAKPLSGMSAAALSIAVDRAGRVDSSSPAAPTSSSSKLPMEKPPSFARAVPGAHSPALQKSFSEEDLGELVAGEVAGPSNEGVKAKAKGEEPPPRISGTPVNASRDAAFHDARSSRDDQSANAKAQSSRRKAINQIGALKTAAKKKSKDFVDSDDEQDDGAVNQNELFGSSDEEDESEKEGDGAQSAVADDSSEVCGA